MTLRRRQFIKRAIQGVAIYGVAPLWSNLLLAGYSNQQDRALQAADENGVRLPKGFTSRIIAQSGQPVIAGQSFNWHGAPDGGACFATDSGGWIYVSNSELRDVGGASAIVFDANGAILDAYSILQGTNRNCAGGAMPWGSWLSCEEVGNGRVWECDPLGKAAPMVRPALGVFNHEAVAIDPASGLIYLTEDRLDGCLYRFTANEKNSSGFPELDAGKLEVAVHQSNNKLGWRELDDPLAEFEPTRYQIADAAVFNGGEGVVFFEGQLIFTTKGDNRVWSYDVNNHQLTVIYDEAKSLTPILSGVDNVTVSATGDIYVAEDGGDLQVVVIDRQGALYPIAQLEGHDKSEITGVAFSPDGKRLYFSSQRGTTGKSKNGVSYEIMGPF